MVERTNCSKIPVFLAKIDETNELKHSLANIDQAIWYQCHFLTAGDRPVEAGEPGLAM